MQTVTLLQQDDWSYKYIGKVEWRADTYESVKDKLVEIDIEDDMFEKISYYWCIPSYIDGNFTIELSDSYINRYKDLRSKAYPSMLDYIDAQVKKSSSDPDVQQQGEQQEQKYLDDCLAVKAQYPKPTV